MTAYTKLQIIHIGTGGLTSTHAVILITIKTSFKWESLLNIGNAYL